MRLLSVAAALLPSLPLAVARRHSPCDNAFANGWLGPAPTQSYHSSPLRPPEVNLLRSAPPTRVTAKSELTFLGYRGDDAKMKGPVILDDDGELVWHGSEYGSVLNVERHQYLEQEVFSFYTGTEQFPGFGSGQWNILDQSYEIIATVQANKSEEGLDPHDLSIRGEVATVEFWKPTRTNLTSVGGSVDGWVYDCRVQSINITSGALLFDWSALAHVPVNDTYYDLKHPQGTRETPFDFFHLNAVQMDEDGNYLLSARGMATVYHINGTDGEVLWKLGGRNSTFHMGTDARFWFQHHARAIRSSPETFNISLFDNGANQYRSAAKQARGLVLNVNTTSLNATVLRQVLPSFGDVCPSEGSMQTFEDGRIVVGWGIRPFYSEFDADNKLVHDVQFGTMKSTVHSYRAFKAKWTAKPKTRPSFFLNSSDIDPTSYASWNGATEIATWKILAGDDVEDLVEVLATPKTGFETQLNVSASWDFVAAAAFDSEGACLGVSEVYSYLNATSTGFAGECPGPLVWEWGMPDFAIGIVFIAIVGLALNLIPYLRVVPALTARWRGGHAYKPLAADMTEVVMSSPDSLDHTAPSSPEQMELFGRKPGSF